MTIQDGKTVEFDYTLTVDGQVVETSEGKEPAKYTHGEGKIVPGLSKELEGMKAGEEKSIEISPEEGYGNIDPKAFHEVPKTDFPQDMELKIGMPFQAKASDGKVFLIRIAQIKDDTVIIDFNHPLAGKKLNFDVKIVSVE